MSSPELAVSDRRDHRWALSLAIVTTLLTLIPYLIGASLAGGRAYMWLGYNLDDSCVYLSWMRQACQGSFHAYNLFTTDAQHGMAMNPLFLLLGLICRLTHLPLLLVYHGTRLLGGCAMLYIVWALIRMIVADSLSRRLAFLFVCVGAGSGWLPLWWVDGPLPVDIMHTPVDAWQPEAITFLSLYLSPLFCVSLALQAGILLLLFRGRRTGRFRDAILAGLCGLMLALIHTYDVLSLSLVWILFLVIDTIRRVRSNQQNRLALSLMQAGIAGGLSAPGVAYIAYQLHTETVFHRRADVATLSPAPSYILLGYGLLSLLALAAVARLIRSKRPDRPDSAQVSSWTGMDTATFAVAWSVANFAAAYLPTAFQRKLLQGEHLPIAILAGVGAVWLSAHPRLRIEPRYRLLAGSCIAAAACLTNLRFMIRDVENDTQNLAQTGKHRPYLKQGEIAALNWVTEKVPHGVAIQPLPYVFEISGQDGHTKIGPSDVSIACFAPGVTGHAVYCGHWGETPDYGRKLSELVRFALPITSDDQRRDLLGRMRVGYLIFSQKDRNDEAADHLAPMFRGMVAPPDYLKLVYSNSEADVYQVDIAAIDRSAPVRGN